MDEPLTPQPIPQSTPVAWLRSTNAAPDAPPTESPTPDALRAAIDLVLAHPEAVTEIIARAPLDAFPLPAGGARHDGWNGRASQSGGLAAQDMSGSPDDPHDGTRSRTPRHDGWNGERMARFLEVLADTGLVTEAARAVGLHRDSAYALRNRDPVFAAAMRAAMAKARALVADGLLERSITGTVEHYYRDGVLVGERRHYESWLGLAVLKRLDKQAQEDRADGTLAERLGTDWNETLEAMRGGGTAAVDAVLKAKADKADTPPNPPGCDDSDHVWQDDKGQWVTTFPPPPGFDGYEKGKSNGFDYYERACTPDEVEAIEASIAAEDSAARADAERARDAWFAKRRAEAEGAPPSPELRRGQAAEG